MSIRSGGLVTPGKALAYVALWAILTAYFVVFEREPEAADKWPKPGRAPLVNLVSEDVQSLEIRSGSRLLQCARRDGRWVVRAPAGARVPADLIESIVNTLTDTGGVEVVSEKPESLADFGLAHPRWELSLAASDGRRVTVALGDRNPAQTAVYAQRESAPQILLAGLNLEYYLDLAMAGLAPH